MESEYIVGLTAVVMAGLAVLIPIAGFTARFALKPFVEAIAQFKSAESGDQRGAILEQRVSLLEEQLHAMDREQQRLLEENDFRRQLEFPQQGRHPD